MRMSCKCSVSNEHVSDAPDPGSAAAMTCAPSDDDGERKASEPPRVSSRDLLAGHREIIIEHGRDEYRLRLTNANKLILTK